MAKKSVTGGRGITGIQFSGKTQDRVPATRSNAMPRANQRVQKNTPYTNQPMVDKGRVAKTVNPFARVTTGLRYAAPIGPSNKGTVPGGRGIMALNSVRMKPTAGAPKATMNATMAAPIKAQVKPATAKATTSKAGKDVVRTTVGMKSSPVRGTNLGVSSGKTTGTSVSRGGTGGRTTGGGRAAGGGYTNAGPAGMGASGRGTGGKR
jgi:hypothetical protein